MNLPAHWRTRPGSGNNRHRDDHLTNPSPSTGHACASAIAVITLGGILVSDLGDSVSRCDPCEAVIFRWSRPGLDD